jgi:hypothetical protein
MSWHWAQPSIYTGITYTVCQRDSPSAWQTDCAGQEATKMIDIILLAPSSFSYARVLFSSCILNNQGKRSRITTLQYNFITLCIRCPAYPHIDKHKPTSPSPKMHVSPDFIAAIVFGVIMMVIGLAAIWIVYWQTGVLQRQQQRASSLPVHSRLSLPVHRLSTKPCLTDFPIWTGDIEAQNISSPTRSSTALSDLSTATTLQEEDSGKAQPAP